jgi:Fe(3+) dicitrate transport protein
MKNLAILFTFCILAISVNAQNTNINGKIVDSNKSAITSATVQVVETKQIAVTDSKGVFSFNLPDGNYKVSIVAKGFATEIKSIESGKSIEIILQPAKIAEVVSITSSYLVGTSEALNQTAGSVQTIDKTELENSRLYNFSEALRKVSGVNVRDEEGFGLRPNIGIRGVNPTRSTKVLLLEDGLPLSYAPYGDNASYYHPPIERFESVEVLKGSGQISYGPTTVAGVVNYITPNPPEKTSLSLKLIGGSRDFFNGNAQFGGTFDKTGIIVNFNRRQGEGTKENVRLGLSDFSSKVVQTINDRNILTGKFSYLKENSQLTYTGATEAEYAANPRGNPFVNDNFDTYRAGFSLQHTAVLTSKINLTTNGYYNFFSRDWWRQSSNSSQRPNRLGGTCRGLIDLNTTCGNEGRLRDYKTYGIESKLNATFDLGQVRNDFNVGLRFHGEKQYRVQKNGTTPTARDGVSVENNFRETDAVSGFFQNRFIWKNVAVTAGVRLEKFNNKRTNRLTNVSGKTDTTEVIPGFGISFNAFKNSTFFAGVHRGFAPPRNEDLISNTGGIVELDAEKSWNYEVGFRTRPISGIALESTFFRTNYENQIVPASIAGGVGAVFTNGGKTLHQGVELNARFDSSNIFKTGYNIYFQTAYTNLFDAKFVGTRLSAISGFTTISVSGNRLPYAPKQLVTSSIGYAYRNFEGFVESNYIGRQFSDDLNVINPIANGQRGAIGSQIYWNATANYRVEKLKSTFFVTAKNLFDRTFIVDRARGILPSTPRLLQGGVKISF